MQLLPSISLLLYFAFTFCQQFVFFYLSPAPPPFWPPFWRACWSIPPLTIPGTYPQFQLLLLLSALSALSALSVCLLKSKPKRGLWRTIEQRRPKSEDVGRLRPEKRGREKGKNTCHYDTNLSFYFFSLFNSATVCVCVCVLEFMPLV